MALLPTIPTSFVPQGASAGRPHIETDAGSALGFIAYALLVISFALALGVFFYGRILSASLTAKNAELAKAEAAIDPATVQSFVQLRDRLNSSKTLLGNHVAMSTFFSTLSALLPATVRFTAFHVVIDATGAARVEGTGVSKSFNALSAASAAFATDGRIKDVIFSKMSINRDSSVSFGFSATLDPKIVTYTGESVQPSTAATATTTTL